MSHELETRAPGADAASVLDEVSRCLRSVGTGAGCHDPHLDPALLSWAVSDAAAGVVLSPQRMLSAWNSAGHVVMRLRQVDEADLGDRLLEALPRDDDALSLALACRDAGALHRLFSDEVSDIAHARLCDYYDTTVARRQRVDVDAWLDERGGLGRSLGPAALDLVRRRLHAASDRLADVSARVSLRCGAPSGAGIALAARWAPGRLGQGGGERWAFVAPARVVGVGGGCDGGAWHDSDDGELCEVAVRFWDGDAAGASGAVELARDILAHR